MLRKNTTNIKSFLAKKNPADEFGFMGGATPGWGAGNGFDPPSLHKHFA
jgi:hypothetical protein